jgi:hypothetical protein
MTSGSWEATERERLAAGRGQRQKETEEDASCLYERQDFSFHVNTSF